jgi:hypothetical protein
MEISMEVPHKIKVKLECDPAILLLATCLKESKSAYNWDPEYPYLIVPLFVTVKFWNQLGVCQYTNG